MSDSLRVTICDGKYTFVQRGVGGSHADRYGERWRDLTGDGLILGLAQEVDTLRELLDEAFPDLASGMMCNPSPDLLTRINEKLDTYRSDKHGRT